jgi:hypothetical protein
MFEAIKENTQNQFYGISEQDITTAQERLGFRLPQSLVTFYQEVGYGFLSNGGSRAGRFMDPQSIAEFRMRTGQFEFSEDLEVYDSFEETQLIFFEVDEFSFVGIGLMDGKIYYLGNEIAEKLEIFLTKYNAEGNYFL